MGEIYLYLLDENHMVQEIVQKYSYLDLFLQDHKNSIYFSLYLVIGDEVRLGFIHILVPYVFLRCIHVQ